MTARYKTLVAVVGLSILAGVLFPAGKLTCGDAILIGIGITCIAWGIKRI